MSLVFFNGDIERIATIDFENACLTMEFDAGSASASTVKYEWRDADKLQHA